VEDVEGRLSVDAKGDVVVEGEPDVFSENVFAIKTTMEESKCK